MTIWIKYATYGDMWGKVEVSGDMCIGCPNTHIYSSNYIDSIYNLIDSYLIHRDTLHMALIGHRIDFKGGLRGGVI